MPSTTPTIPSTDEELAADEAMDLIGAEDDATAAAADDDTEAEDWSAPTEIAEDEVTLATLDPDKPIVVSAFGGIGGFDLGFERAGFQTGALIEWDKAASRVLAARFPHAARFTDVRHVNGRSIQSALGGRRVSVLVGGFPCQDLSVAGRRAGLAGKRSGLYGELLRLAEELDPDWLVFENVPGLLSSEDGADFGQFCGDVTGFYPAVPKGGWRSAGVVHGPRGTLAWRVLDARHFGVAQRRRRVFIVFCAGDRVAPAAILLEPQGLRRDPEASVPTWARAAATAVGAAVGRRLRGADGGGAGKAQAPDPEPVAELGDPTYVPDVGRALLASGANPSWDHTLDTYIGHNEAHGGEEISPTVTSKWAKGSGGPAGSGSETANLVAPRQGVDIYNAALTGDESATVVSTTGTGIHGVIEPQGVGGGHDQGVPRVIGGHYGDQEAHTVTASGTDGLGRGVPIIGEQDAPAQSWGISSDAIERTGEGAAGNASERAGLGITEELSPTLRASHPQGVVSVTGEQTHALTAEGADASEDGTGRGTPLVPYAPDVAATLTAGSHAPGVSAPGRRQEDEHNLVAERIHYRKSKRAANDTDDETWVESEETNTLNLNDVGDTRATEIVVEPIAFGHTQGLDPQASTEHTPTLRANGGGAGVMDGGVFPSGMPMSSRVTTGEVAATAQSGENRGGVEGQRILDHHRAAVRRLTPRECERLQGFPPILTPLHDDARIVVERAGCLPRGDGSYAAWDHVHAALLVAELGRGVTVEDWTGIPGQSDSARYKELGNAVCANVSEWVATQMMGYMNGTLLAYRCPECGEWVNRPSMAEGAPEVCDACLRADLAEHG